VQVSNQGRLRSLAFTASATGDKHETIANLRLCLEHPHGICASHDACVKCNCWPRPFGAVVSAGMLATGCLPRSPDGGVRVPLQERGTTYSTEHAYCYACTLLDDEKHKDWDFVRTVPKVDIKALIHLLLTVEPLGASYSSIDQVRFLADWVAVTGFPQDFCRGVTVHRKRMCPADPKRKLHTLLRLRSFFYHYESWRHTDARSH
jgi:hypothetical protein